MHRSGKQRGSAAAICIALAGVLSAQSISGAAHDSPRVKRILVLGDSLSAGYLLRPTEAWPMLLTSQLRAAGLEFEIINASQSGGTTTGGLARLPAHLERRIDIFILELGINDAFRGVSVAEIEQNLQEMIDRVRASSRGVHVIIAGMQLSDYSADPYLRAFGQMYSELAAKNHAALVPYLLKGVGGNPALNLGDHIHPNAAGHKILAQTVWSVLEPIARDVAQQRTAAASR
jgi:acyl-CoA thioesterase I